MGEDRHHTDVGLWYMVLQPNRKKHMQQNLETVSFKGFPASRRSKVSGANAERRCIHIGVGLYPVAGSCALGFWLAAVLSCAALQGIWTYYFASTSAAVSSACKLGAHSEQVRASKAKAGSERVAPPVVGAAKDIADRRPGEGCAQRCKCVAGVGCWSAGVTAPP